jgi:chemotaxis protein MotB
MITGVVKELPNKVSVRGHTDSSPYGKDATYTNWELSADRANASRRVMLGAGYDSSKVENVQGKADREPLNPKDPAADSNRRISLILLKQSLTSKGGKAAKGRPVAPSPKKPEPKKREEGVIYFP